MNTNFFVHDRLYGQIQYSAQDLRLFQTKELARLRHVSLSAIPTWMIPAGVCASKFEHSVGVGHLARIVSQRHEFKDVAQDLYFAALAHDLGTPPFSHASEYFQQQLLGKNHEEFIDEVIVDSEFAKEVINQGGDIDRVVAFVKGDGVPISDVVNGSIDIDNLDNSLRFGLSLGLIDHQLYSPEMLAQMFTINLGQLVLDAKFVADISGWESVRRLVYTFVYGSQNMAPGMMLYRALEFAMHEGELKREYFFMTDAQALEYLSTKCNVLTQKLVTQASLWQWYLQVFSYSSQDVSQTLAEYIGDSKNRKLLSEAVAKDLKIPPEDISVYMGKDKGFKQIHLPILGDNQLTTHTPERKLQYMVQVYLHPKWKEKSRKVEAFIKAFLQLPNS